MLLLDGKIWYTKEEYMEMLIKSLKDQIEILKNVIKELKENK